MCFEFPLKFIGSVEANCTVDLLALNTVVVEGFNSNSFRTDNNQDNVSTPVNNDISSDSHVLCAIVFCLIDLLMIAPLLFVSVYVQYPLWDLLSSCMEKDESQYRLI